MNIWEHQNEYKKNLRILTKDGKVFIGKMLSILDADDLEENEAQVHIETESGILALRESEIKSIKSIMTDLEISLLRDLRNRIENRLSAIYEQPLEVDGQKCFLQGKQHYFMITALPLESPGALVIEHADSFEEATISKYGRSEDGDLFWLDEYDNDEDKMFAAMLREIEDD